MSLDASFRALNRYMCRKIIDVLRRNGPQAVADIHPRVKIVSRASVSQSLAVLLKAEMISVHRRGRNNIYQLRPGPFREVEGYCKALAQDAGRSRRT